MTEQDFTSLVGSRICHDLANPLGAIGNGVELLGMSIGQREEMSLIEEALAGAKARMDFFRIAFGAAAADQTIARKTIEQLFAQLSQSGRHRMIWQPAADPSRVDTRAAFLAMLCVETALPLGGEITLGADWKISGTGRRVATPPELWDPLQRLLPPEGLTGAQVQFGLLPAALDAAGRTLALEASETHIALQI